MSNIEIAKQLLQSIQPLADTTIRNLLHLLQLVTKRANFTLKELNNSRYSLKGKSNESCFTKSRENASRDSCHSSELYKSSCVSFCWILANKESPCGSNNFSRKTLDAKRPTQSIGTEDNKQTG